MVDVYKNIDNYNPTRKRKTLIVFDDILSNKKLQAVINELFIRYRKLNFHLFLFQSYFSIQKDIRLNSTRYLIMKINNKRELQNNAINDSPDVDYKNFVESLQKMYKRTIFFFENWYYIAY